MFEQAIWIGLENCALAPWKGQKIDGTVTERLKETIDFN